MGVSNYVAELISSAVQKGKELFKGDDSEKTELVDGGKVETTKADKPELAAAEIEIKEGSARDLVKYKTELGVEELKGKMGEQFAGLSSAMELNGDSISEISVPKDLEFEAQREPVCGKVLKLLDGHNLSGFVKILKEKVDPNVTDGNVKVFLANAYTNAIFAKIKLAMGKYPNYKEFVEKKPDSALYCSVKFGMGGEMTLEFNKLEEFEKEYKEFVPEKAETPEEVKTELDAVSARKDPRVVALKGSMFGKLALLFGFIHVDKTKTPEEAEAEEYGQWAAIVNGTHWLSDVVVLLGGGALVSAQRSSEEILEVIPEKQRDLVNEIVKKGRGSFLNLEKVKPKGFVEVFEPVKPDVFEKIIDGTAKMPEKAFKIEEVYEFENGKFLTINLKDGEMILPAESKTRIDDKPVNVEKGKTELRKGAPVKISENIPAGTIFKGKVVFVLPGGDK